MPRHRVFPRTASPESSIARTCGGSTLRRIIWIHQRLGHDLPATATSLAEELEVSERTIKRDLDFMRDDFNAPIAWDAGLHRYYYTRPFDLLPLLSLTAEEVIALTLAGDTFAAWRGSPLGAALHAALAKIARVVGGAVSLSGDTTAALIFPAGDRGAEHAEQRHFTLLFEAIRHRRVLRLRYAKPGRVTPELRQVEPLHLAHADHRWMLIAHDQERAAPRNFLLERIQVAEPTGDSFARRDFDAQAYLRGSLGRFTGATEHHVQLKIDATIIPYLRERPWHPSQTLAPRADGWWDVTLRLNNLIDIERRVLACGAHIEVVAPAELRQTVAQTAQALAARYAKAPIRQKNDEFSSQ